MKNERNKSMTWFYEDVPVAPGRFVMPTGGFVLLPHDERILR